VRDNETIEFTAFAKAIAAVEHSYEFVVIDTPASDSYLMRLAHSLADTVVSPVNESFINVDVFSRVHHNRTHRGLVAHYADLVLEARRKRRLVDNGIIDWVLVRNRSLSIQSNNARQVAMSLQRLAAELQFRVAEGLHDRVIFRELFPIGLTALDPIEMAVQNQVLTSSQLGGRKEIDTLVQTLRLPVHQPGVPYIEARHRWYEGLSHYYRNLAASGD
jgi:chromosome partitioning protein